MKIAIPLSVILLSTLLLTGCSPGATRITADTPLIINESSEHEPIIPVENPEPETQSPPESVTPPEAVTPPDISASIEIINCEQVYYSFGEWDDFVDIDYEITNSGDTDILGYDLYFTAYCGDGSEYTEIDGSVILDVGETNYGYLFVDVDAKECTRVEVTDWELRSVNHPPVTKSATDTNPSTPCEKAKPDTDAIFTIDEWEQEYDDYFEEWDYLFIYYEIENTGVNDIDYYEVYFTIKCGNKEYTDWTNGTNVKPGRTYSDSIIVDTNGRKVTSVSIDDYELTSY